jgi:hypothetical protein
MPTTSSIPPPPVLKKHVTKPLAKGFALFNILDQEEADPGPGPVHVSTPRPLNTPIMGVSYAQMLSRHPNSPVSPTVNKKTVIQKPTPICNDALKYSWADEESSDEEYESEDEKYFSGY